MPREADDVAHDLARRSAAAMYATDVAVHHLSVTVDDVSPGRATTRMKVTDTMINGHDICHGGYVFLLADTAFAYACNTYGVATVAAACDVVFIAPGRLGDELVAEACERTRFGRSGVYDVTVRREDGAVVAEFRGHSRATSRSLLPPDGEVPR